MINILFVMYWGGWDKSEIDRCGGTVNSYMKESIKLHCLHLIEREDWFQSMIDDLKMYDTKYMSKEEGIVYCINTY